MVRAGVVTMAEVNAGPSQVGTKKFDATSPATWSLIWFVLSLAWLMYAFGRNFRPIS